MISFESTPPVGGVGALAAESAAQRAAATIENTPSHTNLRISSLFTQTHSLPQQFLGDSHQLDVARALINPADFGVAIEFLHWILFGDPNAPEYFDRLGCHFLRDL